MSYQLLLVNKSVAEKWISELGLIEGNRGWGIRFRSQVSISLLSRSGELANFLLYSSWHDWKCLENRDSVRPWFSTGYSLWEKNNQRHLTIAFDREKKGLLHEEWIDLGDACSAKEMSEIANTGGCHKSDLSRINRKHSRQAERIKLWEKSTSHIPIHNCERPKPTFGEGPISVENDVPPFDQASKTHVYWKTSFHVCTSFVFVQIFAHFLPSLLVNIIIVGKNREKVGRAQKINTPRQIISSILISFRRKLSSILII